MLIAFAAWFLTPLYVMVSTSLKDMEQVRTDLNAWRQTLADGYPIIFAIKLYKSFDKHKKRGLVPTPLKTELGRKEHSGHAMLCVGYSDTDLDDNPRADGRVLATLTYSHTFF